MPRRFAYPLLDRTKNGIAVRLLEVEDVDELAGRAVEARATVDMRVDEMFLGRTLRRPRRSVRTHRWAVSTVREQLTPDDIASQTPADIASAKVATFVLIHGAASDSWYWHLVVPEVIARGHDVVAPDLPSDDDSAGLTEYTDAVVDAIGDRTDLVVVAQSLGGFTAPLVCVRVPVSLMVLVAAMVPSPRESAGAWWSNTGHEQARREQALRDGRSPDAGFDPMVDFFHDVRADVVAEAFARGERAQSETVFEDPWPLESWPDVPTRFLLCRDDRFFPAEFQRRVVADRSASRPMRWTAATCLRSAVRRSWPNGS